MPDYGFRPLVPADRALFDAWLAGPHVAGWWGDAEAEWALIEEDWASARTGRPVTDMRIVTHGGRPFAYVQDWDVRDHDAPQYADLPEGSRAIDTFLGDPAYLGRGHAPAYLRARADALLEAGAPCVAVDPDPGNARALAAYARAGFEPHREVPCEDGDPVRVMLRRG
jgi:aminoglycoside 6'-N-acetyltransferase